MGLSDDVVYLGLLVSSILVGSTFKSYHGDKKTLGSAIGLAICGIVCGNYVLHALALVTVNALLITYFQRRCHTLSVIFTLPYLLFFRGASCFGLIQPPAFANVVIMMLTLKMIGLAFEVHDTRSRRHQVAKASEESRNEDSEKLSLTSKYSDIDPSFPDIFHYAFCYIGVLTGPYYKYRVWQDMLENKSLESVPTFKIAVERAKYVPLYAVLFLVSARFFPIDYALSDEFLTERSILYRMFYAYPLFFVFRMRLYSAFILSEVACIAAGLGAYPKQSHPKSGAGPTNLPALENNDEGTEYSFETILNVDPYQSESSTTVRTSMKTWNTTVQYWLAMNIHKRVTIKPLKLFATMLVSAYWHGVYPGHYLSLCSAAFAVAAEDVFAKKYKDQYPAFVSAFGLMYKHTFFAYFGVSFLMLEIGKTLIYWKSVYFFGHIVVAITFLAGYFGFKKSQSMKTE